MTEPVQNLESDMPENELPMLLSSHCMPIPATFRFNCFETIFDAAIRRSPEGGSQMVVRGQLGDLPFTVESKEVRRQLTQIVDASAQIPYAEISLDRTQSIIVRGQVAFNGIPTPAEVAAGATVITVAIKPICDLINGCRTSAAEADA